MKGQSKIVKNWTEYFQDIGLLKNISSYYLEYISDLTSKELPIIFEFNHLCLLLGRTNNYLASAINSAQHHYREFTIPKRRNGERIINAPYPALLECQKWINKNILSKIHIHYACHGFTKKRSIVTNAKYHLNQKSLLHMDLEDFFPSISKKRVIKTFRTMGYLPNVSYYLASLCCVDGILPQGAATSPQLSNIIAYGLDLRLFKLARSYDLNYTRYADDITFSGYYIPNNLIDIISGIIEEQGFNLNKRKTYLSLSKGRRVITGLLVSGDRLRIPRKYRRKLRQEIYFILKDGYFTHINRLKIRDPYYLNSIYGKLQFWKSIEPEDGYVSENLEKIANLIETLH